MHSRTFPQGRSAITVAVLVSVGVLLVVGFVRGWHAPLVTLVRSGGQAEPADEHSGQAHAEDDEPTADDHGHEGHDETNSIELTPEARRSLKLRTGEVTLGTFIRRIVVPGTIVPWPGRTHVTIAAPLTGTVTSVHVAQGESVTSGDALYTLRLTHQDLVRIQSEYLQRLGEADVERREIERLTEVAQSGAIARRSLLERQYALEKLQAELRAMRESLLLHGLSDTQVQRIESERKLIREVTIFAPLLHGDRSLHDDALEGGLPQFAIRPAGYEAPDAAAGDSASDLEHIEVQFVVTGLAAERGESVNTGDALTILANYEVLLVEGHAFQQDAEELTRAAESNTPVQAVLETGGDSPRVLDGLQIAYVGSAVRAESRALPFYVPLENERLREELRGQRRYTSWRFRPGQRLRLRVGVDRVEGVLVLPAEAVATEGAESYVFVENGDHFDRRAVEVVTRDQLSVAVANSGAVFPGETVALSDAHQLQMALKNSAGGGVDPHAGHNH